MPDLLAACDKQKKVSSGDIIFDYSCSFSSWLFTFTWPAAPSSETKVRFSSVQSNTVTSVPKAREYLTDRHHAPLISATATLSPIFMFATFNGE